MSRGLQATAHYTWSRTRDQTDHSNNNDGRGTQDPYNPMADYGPAYWDVPHRFVASYVYELPFFKTSEQPVLKHDVGGWQVSGITTIESGRPVRREDRPGRREHRPHAAATGPRRHPNEQLRRGTGQLHYGRRVQDAGAIHVWQHAAQHPARSRSGDDGPVVGQELPAQGPYAVPVPSRGLQSVQPAELRQPNATFGTANFGRITSADSMRQMQFGMKIIF